MYNYHLCISSNTLFTNSNWYLRQEEKQISGSSGAVGEEAFIATVSNADCAVAKRLVIPFSLKIAYQQYPQDCCYLFHHRHSRYQLDNKHSSLWRYIPLINYYAYHTFWTCCSYDSYYTTFIMLLGFDWKAPKWFLWDMTLYQLSWQDHWT